MQKVFSSIFLCILLFATTAAAEPIGNDRLGNFWNLSDQEIGARSFGESSFDRTGLNEDGFTGLFSRLYFDNGRHVIFDSEGPGCIYRAWFTHLKPGAVFEFYFGDEANPRYAISQEELFENSTAPFLQPLVWDDDFSSGGFVSYVPICYSQRLRIATAKNIYFYNINATGYFDDTPVEDFDENADLSDASALYDPANAGEDPKDNSLVTYEEAILNIDPGQEVAFFDLEAAGQIAALFFTPSEITDSLLNEVYLRIWVDDPDTPKVDMPLGLFFGATRAGNEMRGLMTGIVDGKMYCYFPMPYFSWAKIAVKNGSGEAVTIDYEVGTLNEMPPDHALYFEAAASISDPPELGVDHPIVIDQGQGKIVGVVQISGGNSGQIYLEGDERYYPDGLLTPTIHGTGTEDYYNGGWYFDRGTFAKPTHGHQQRYVEAKGFNDTGMYRQHLSDALYFHDGVVFSVEHDFLNLLTDELIQTGAALYRIDEPALVLMDIFNVEDLFHQTKFAFDCDGCRSTGPQTLSYEGDNDSLEIEDSGIETDNAVSMTLTLNPDNDGIRIQRRIDQRQSRQIPAVYVDGDFVGTWIEPHSNVFKGWRDSVFDISAQWTKSKRQILLQLVNEGGTPFNQFEYKFFAWKKPILSRMTALSLDADNTEVQVGGIVQMDVMGQYPSANEEAVAGWVEYEIEGGNLRDLGYGLFQATAPGQATIRAYIGDVISNDLVVEISAADAAPIPDDDDEADDDDDNDTPDRVWADLKGESDVGGCGC